VKVEHSDGRLIIATGEREGFFFVWIFAIRPSRLDETIQKLSSKSAAFESYELKKWRNAAW